MPKLDALLLEWLEKLRPSEGFMRLYKTTVLRVWKEQETSIAKERETARRRLVEIDAKIDRLTKRALLADDFDPEAVKRVREDLEREKLVAEISAVDLELDALDVETVLDFAEHVLTNAGRLWLEATPEQRLRLGAVLFPEGDTYADGEFKTPLSAFQFSELRGSEDEKAGLVDQLVSNWNPLQEWLRALNELRQVLQRPKKSA